MWQSFQTDQNHNHEPNQNPKEKQNNSTKQNSGPKRPPLFPASDLVFYGLIALSLGIGLYLPPFLPEKIAPHFSGGEPTRYESPYFTIWFVPLLTAGLVFFMNLVHWVSNFLEDMMDDPPKPKNEEDRKRFSYLRTIQSKRAFFWIKLILVTFMIGIYFYILYWNLPGTDPDQFLLQHGISLLMCALFIGLGALMFRSERPLNIPWWKESPPPRVNRIFHQRIGISFLACGVLIILLSFLSGTMQGPGTLIIVTIIPLAGVVWGFVSAQKEWNNLDH